jgi:hypothetical protein
LDPGDPVSEYRMTFQMDLAGLPGRWVADQPFGYPGAGEGRVRPTPRYSASGRCRGGSLHLDDEMPPRMPYWCLIGATPSSGNWTRLPSGTTVLVATLGLAARRRTRRTTHAIPPTASRDLNRAPAGRAGRRVRGRGHSCEEAPAPSSRWTCASTLDASTCRS